MTTTYIFDVDLTLANHRETALRPTAAYWLQQNKPQRVALATNQGGVGLRRWMEDSGFGEPSKYPTETAVRERIAAIADNIRAITGGDVTTYIAFSYLSQKGNWSPIPQGEEANPEWSHEWRKPNPGMLLQAASDFGVNPSNCTFVGNSAEDEQAAAAAGMLFIDERQMFGLTVEIYYRAGYCVDWLRPEERIGLNLEATYARFEELMRRDAGNASHVREVIFHRLQDASHDVVFEPREALTAILGPNSNWAKFIVDNLDVNREWLVYESATEHAEALWDNPVAKYSLPAVLMAVYGTEKPHELIREVSGGMWLSG